MTCKFHVGRNPWARKRGRDAERADLAGNTAGRAGRRELTGRWERVDGAAVHARLLERNKCGAAAEFTQEESLPILR